MNVDAEEALYELKLRESRDSDEILAAFAIRLLLLVQVLSRYECLHAFDAGILRHASEASATAFRAFKAPRSGFAMNPVCTFSLFFQYYITPLAAGGLGPFASF